MFDVIASRQFPHDLVEARTNACDPWHFSSNSDECAPFCIVNCAHKMNTLNDGRKSGVRRRTTAINRTKNVQHIVGRWYTTHVPCDVCLAAVRAAKNHRRAVNFYDRTETKIVSYRSRPDEFIGELLRRSTHLLLFTFLMDKLLLLPLASMEAAAAAIKRIHIFRGTAPFTLRPSPRHPCTDLCKIL